MKMFAVLALCVVGAAAAPSAYGSYDAPAVRVSGYEAPTVRVVTPAYAEPMRTYGEVKGYEPIVKKFVPILRYSLNDDNHGTFNLESVSGDGTTITESGSLRNLGDKEGPAAVKTGSYSYTGDDGKTYSVNWSADENGFIASGAHLPTPVPMPAELTRAYDEARAALAAAPASSGYETPVRGYGGYETPAIRVSGYEAPAVRVVSSGYEAPVVRVSGYEAPAPVELKTQTYEAPNFKVVASPY